MPSYAEVLMRGSARYQRRRNNAPPQPQPPPQPSPPPPPQPSPPPSPPPQPSPPPPQPSPPPSPPSPPPPPSPSPPPAPPGGQQEMQSDPGYSFCPTDQEIIVQYLRKKMEDPDFKSSAIPDKDVYSFDPWELYDGEQMTTRENLFFFTKTVVRGFNRAAKGGHWIMTMPDRFIKIDGVWGGMRRQFEFIKGQEQSKTNWTIYEYSVPGNDSQAEGWVVCRVFEQQDSSINNEQTGSSQSAGPPVSNNNCPQQQGQQLPVNRSSSHSDAPTVYSRNQQPVNMPATPPGPAHTASSMASITPYNYNMVNEQLRPCPNVWMPDWPPNSNFLQPDIRSTESLDPWFYDQDQHQLNTPTTLQQKGWNPDQPQHFNMGATRGQNQPDYRSMTDSDGRRSYVPNQQGQPQPVNRSSTHSDAPTVDSHNQLPVNTPTTMQGPPDPTAPYSCDMVNQQLPGPNMRTFNPNFMQPGSASSTDPWFYNHNQHQWDAPTTLQGPNQPGYTSWTHSDEQQQIGWNPDQQQQFNMAATQGQNQPDYRSMTDSDGRRYYSHNQQNPTMPAQQGLLYPYGPAHPASNMISTYYYNMGNQQQPRIITPPYHYNMGNQQQPGIRPPRYLRQNISMYPDTRVVGVGGNFNSYFPRPDGGSSSSHNQRPPYQE